MKRFLSILLVLLLILSFSGCSGSETPEPSATIDPGAEILAQRRDQAESYMRQMATVLWRATEDITYTNNSKSTDPLVDSLTDLTVIKAGRLYRGIPYTHSASNTAALLEYAGEPDEKGIYTVSGLTWQSLNGDYTTARIGNDCSSAVGLSWGILGNSLTQVSKTKYMTEDYGYIPVGEYQTNADYHPYTVDVAVANGMNVMCNAYALLQKADGVVKRNASDTNGHAMMIVSNEVFYNGGSVDPIRSYVTVLEQTSGRIESQDKVYSEELGEDVYRIYIVDKKYTYNDLFTAGYLPITCKELIDPSPVAEPGVTDSENQHSLENLFKGKLTATRFISAVSVIITDSSGAVIQQCSASPTSRYEMYHFDMETFITERPEALRGSLDLDALTSGSYSCKVVCRLITDDEITLRDFQFKK